MYTVHSSLRTTGIQLDVQSRGPQGASGLYERLEFAISTFEEPCERSVIPIPEMSSLRLAHSHGSFRQSDEDPRVFSSTQSLFLTWTWHPLSSDLWSWFVVL